jgi:phenylacetate-CoA ligase
MYGINAQSRAELSRRQIDDFRRLVAHVNEQSLYYASLIKDHKISLECCLPTDFPLLTKQLVLDNFDKIVTVGDVTKAGLEQFLRSSKNPLDLFQGKYIAVTSSGTSGRPGMYVYSTQDYAAGMSCARRMPMAEINAGRRIRVAYVGLVEGHHAGITMVSSLLRGENQTRFELLSIDINSPWKKIVELLDRYSPDVLLAYTTAMRELSVWKEEGRLSIAPKLLQCGAEVLTPTDRAAIEKAFSVILLNVYGAAECLYLGYGSSGEHLTLCEDNVIFELHSDYTAITNLYNYTMPLIRYRLNDVLIEKKEPDVGQPYMLVREMIGREEFSLNLENDDGVSESISGCTLAAFHVPGIRRCQFVSFDKKAFTVRVWPEEGLSNDEKAAILENVTVEVQKILWAKELSRVRFDVVQVGELLGEKRTGKFKLVCYPGSL